MMMMMMMALMCCTCIDSDDNKLSIFSCIAYCSHHDNLSMLLLHVLAVMQAGGITDKDAVSPGHNVRLGRPHFWSAMFTEQVIRGDHFETCRVPLLVGLGLFGYRYWHWCSYCQHPHITQRLLICKARNQCCSATSVGLACM